MIRTARTALILSLLVCACRRDSDPPLPEPDATGANVLFIVVDTLRADQLGCYGSAHPTSPTIDALAADGAMYTHAYSYSDGTLHSHAALFSSRYVEAENLNGITAPTLAEVFRAAGYRTYCAAANPLLAPSQGFQRGFDVFTNFPVRPELREQAFNPDDFNAQTEVRSAEETTNTALQMLEFHRQRTPDTPWLMFINYLDPHDPYTERKPWSDEFHESPSHIDGYLRHGDSTTLWEWISRESPKLSTDDVRRLEELYDAEIRYTDSQIARLLDAIDKAGERERTIVVITSDHGEMFGERHMFTHMLGCYEDELHVPLVVWSPFFTQRGQRLDDLVEGIDVTPTLISMCGLDVPDSHLGRILLSPGGKRISPPREFTRHYHWALSPKLRKSLGFPEEQLHDAVVLRKGQWKVYLFKEHEPLIVDTSNYPAVVPLKDDDTRRRLVAWAGSVIGQRDTRGDDTTDPQIEKALRSLGYVK